MGGPQERGDMALSDEFGYLLSPDGQLLVGLGIPRFPYGLVYLIGRMVGVRHPLQIEVRQLGRRLVFDIVPPGVGNESPELSREKVPVKGPHLPLFHLCIDPHIL